MGNKANAAAVMNDTRHTEQVFLSLGSNVGDRARNLRAALEALDGSEGIRLRRVSGCYETEPIGVKDQPAFLNVAAEIETVLQPLELLNAVKDVERGLGRIPSVRWGPRLIDIDIVLWGSRVIDTDRLSVPHPRFRSRAFVLAPLAEIAPDAVDPVTGLTVAELAASPDATGRVEQVAAPGFGP